MRISKRNLILGIIAIILIIIISILLIKQFSKDEKPDIKVDEKKQDTLIYNTNVEGIANINNIYIYGMHLNLSGEVNTTSDISSIELVLFNKSDKKRYNLEYEYIDNKVKFYLSNKINEGIYLDEILKGEYQVLLKITSSDEVIRYYSLNNNTAYSYMDYYTITRNGKNNYIEISTLSTQMVIRVTEKTLPKDVYDITIDPGHGGDDPGAVKNDIYESYINLEVALKLKKELENLGLKVKITRTGDYNPGNIAGISPYGKGGRVAIGYETKSKLFLSVHSNNLPLYPQNNGVEIYTSTNNNKQLAGLIASNIVKELFGEYKIMDALSNYKFYKKGLVKLPVPANDHIEPFIGNVSDLWTYYCCVQVKGVSNKFFSMPSQRNRVLGYQMYKFNVKGFLHWGYNFWYKQFSTGPVDPFTETDAGGSFPSGDSFVVYPGDNGAPLISLRLKVFYDAFQDMRALQLLESLIGKEKTMQILEDGIEPITFAQYPHCDDWQLATREKINAAIKQAIAE